MVRDEQRDVVFSVTAKMNNIQNPLQIELMAILFGVKPLLEKGFSRVIVESDSKTVVSIINRGSSNFWDGGAWIVDILEFAESFKFISFNFVRKETNHLAHMLIKLKGECNMFTV